MNDQPRTTTTIELQLQATRHSIQTERTELNLRKQMGTYDMTDFAPPVVHDSSPDAL